MQTSWALQEWQLLNWYRIYPSLWLNVFSNCLITAENTSSITVILFLHLSVCILMNCYILQISVFNEHLTLYVTVMACLCLLFCLFCILMNCHILRLIIWWCLSTGSSVEVKITMKRDLNIYLYTCGQCEKCFSTKSGLHKHADIHGSKYKCTECGRCCQSSNRLAEHMRSHSGEKPFECTVCNKRFTRPDHLVIHSRVHSGEKPYKCLMCDKAFSQSGNLNDHMKVHTGDKPYTCSLCNKQFGHSCSLEKHKRRVHSNKKRP